MLNKRAFTIIITLICCFTNMSMTYAQEDFASSRNLNLPVVEVRQTYLPYASFCEKNPGHCDMVGASIIELTDDLMLVLSEVNTAVNVSINNTFSDRLLYDMEEHWTYPTEGYGDCEDIALEKRKRLVERGIPRAAMTMAIVSHKKLMFSHAVILIETTDGTYILDSRTEDVSLWNEVPFNYESRERIDGSWERFDQSIWTYE